MPDDFLTRAKIWGRMTCPSDDGDFTLTVYDLETWSSGSCLIRQEGQGQVHDLVLTQHEAKFLSDILKNFASKK